MSMHIRWKKTDHYPCIGVTPQPFGKGWWFNEGSDGYTRLAAVLPLLEPVTTYVGTSGSVESYILAGEEYRAIFDIEGV